MEQAENKAFALVPEITSTQHNFHSAIIEEREIEQEKHKNQQQQHQINTVLWFELTKNVNWCRCRIETTNQNDH